MPENWHPTSLWIQESIQYYKLVNLNFFVLSQTRVFDEKSWQCALLFAHTQQGWTTQEKSTTEKNGASTQECKESRCLSEPRNSAQTTMACCRRIAD